LMSTTFFFNQIIRMKGKKFGAHSHSNVKPWFPNYQAFFWKVIGNFKNDITRLGIWKLIGLQNGNSFHVANLGCNNFNNIMWMLCSQTYCLFLMCKSSRIDAYIYNWCKYIQHVHLLSGLL
jgi:hypothetical protein